MNDLEIVYGYYNSNDDLLKVINDRKSKSIKRSGIKKGAYWNTVIELAKVHEFILLSGEGSNQIIAITEKGISHLQNGGFKEYVYLPTRNATPKTFKQQLDDIAGLLTIFGILNAVTIFASQINSSTQINPSTVKNIFSLNITGIQFVSISMYALSILVLWEIISTLLKEPQDKFKFNALYILLCGTTLGIALLFLDQYKEFVYLILYALAFFGFVFLIFWGLFKIMTKLITRKNALWFKKHSSKLITILLFFSLILSGIFLKLAIRIILKK